MAKEKIVKEQISFTVQEIRVTGNVLLSVHTPSYGITYAESMAVLEKNHQRPLTDQEIFALLASPEIFASCFPGLSGKRLHLYGKGLKQHGDLEFDEYGRLKPSTKNTPKCKKARVWAGPEAPILYVLADPYDTRQYNLGATLPPSNLVSVVVGVPIDTPINTVLIPALISVTSAAQAGLRR
ncbi:MAG: hypothetical protein ACYCO0_00675 [Candidatus Micrarchaeaceae archaeon]